MNTDLSPTTPGFQLWTDQGQAFAIILGVNQWKEDPSLSISLSLSLPFYNSDFPSKINKYFKEISLSLRKLKQNCSEDMGGRGTSGNVTGIAYVMIGLKIPRD